MGNLAVIDVGSNAIRLVIGKVTKKGKVKREVRLREPVRLGADTFCDDCKISEKNLKKTVSAFKKFKREFAQFDVAKWRVVATSAVREAQNKDWFLKQIFKQTGLAIDIIDGREEARLIKQAVDRKWDLSKKTALIMDIGGGSVEFALCKNGRLRKIQSFKIGTVRLLKQAGRHLNSRVHLQELVYPVRSRLLQMCKDEKIEIFVGTGGNIEAMAYLKKRILGKSPSIQIHQHELARISRVLFSQTYEQRVRQLGLRPDRADVILPAVVICATVLSLLPTAHIYVPKVGLREGALAELA